MTTRLLTFALVLTGFIVGLTSVGGLYVLNDRRDDQIRRAASVEAWSRYRTALDACERGNVLRLRINGITAADPGERLPPVDCANVIPRPTIPPPKEQR